MSKSSQPIPVKGHPGIFRKGNRYQVRYRHHGRQRAKSFRTLTEAKRFKAKVDSGDTPADIPRAVQVLRGAMDRDLHRPDCSRSV